MENEIWKDIPGYEGYYQVSNYGRVKSMYFNAKKTLGYNIKINPTEDIFGRKEAQNER